VILRARGIRDALGAGLLVLAGGITFTTFDSAERVSSRLRMWEHLEIDDLLLTAALAVAACSWFAWRRWRDAARELRARRRSEEQNELYMRRLEQLSGQLIEAEQEARTRLADVLHDEIGQTLYAARLQLDRLEPRLADREGKAQLAHIHELVEDMLTRTRDLTLELSPPVLHDLGLGEALEWLAERTQARAQLEVRIANGSVWQSIPGSWHEPLFQSIRELLTNVVKHAGASRVDVSAAHSGDGTLRVCVRDDGRGFVYEGAARRGFGLFSTERRMAWLGAAMRVESAVGAGTSITLVLPAS
jgi:signal transduction histidine kinase